jgi:hypothetical protein
LNFWSFFENLYFYPENSLILKSGNPIFTNFNSFLHCQLPKNHLQLLVSSQKITKMLQKSYIVDLTKNKPFFFSIKYFIGKLTTFEKMIKNSNVKKIFNFQQISMTF